MGTLCVRMYDWCIFESTRRDRCVDAWNAGRATISVVVIILFVAYLCEKAVWPILGYAVSALGMRNLDVAVISWPDRELVGVLFLPLIIPIISTVNQRWNGFAGFYVQICTTPTKCLMPSLIFTIRYSLLSKWSSKISNTASASIASNSVSRIRRYRSSRSKVRR